MRIVSDALPIQWWLIDDDTYNDTQFGFSDKISFYQRWQCDDLIKTQIVDDNLTKNYSLRFTKCDGSPFTIEGLPALPAVNTWANLGATGINWAAAAFNSGTGFFAKSKYWGTPFNFIADVQYHFNWAVTVAPGVNMNYVRIVTLDAGDVLVETLYSNPGFTESIDNLMLTPTLNAAKIAVVAQNADAGTSEHVAINKLELYSSSAEYLGGLSFDQYLSPGTTSLDFLNNNFGAVLAPWTNYNPGGSVNFAWVGANQITADGTAGSKRETSILYQTRPDGYSLGWAGGVYSIHLIGYNHSTGADAGTMYAQGFGSNDGVTWAPLGSSGSIATGAFDFNLNLSIPFGTYYKYIGFLFNIGPPGNVIIVDVNLASQVNSFRAAYCNTFSANSLIISICDDPLGVKMFLVDAGVDIYKSDIHLFLSSIENTPSWGTKLIGYKSFNSFAGICYPTDDQYFNLRVDCQFFRQRPKGSQESLSLSGDQVISTSIIKGLQRLLKTVYLPDYIHNKIELALQHSAGGTVTIDNRLWTLEEAYEVVPPDEKSPMQMGKVWLSDSNYSIRKML